MEFNDQDITFVENLIKNTTIYLPYQGNKGVIKLYSETKSFSSVADIEKNLISLYYQQWNNSNCVPTEDEEKYNLKKIPTADRIVFNYDHWWDIEGKLDDYNGYVILEKGQKKRQELAGRFVVQGEESGKQKFDIVWTRYALKANSQESNMDWYWIYSKELITQDHTNGVRFYFNLKVEDLNSNFVKERAKINRFVEYLKDRLNERRVPFDFKIPQNLTFYCRNDVAVLYLQRSHFYYYADIIKDIYDFAKALKILKKDIKLPFTKEIFDGLYFAENPSNIDFSFGDFMATIIAKLKIKFDEEKPKPNDLKNYIVDFFCETGGWKKESIKPYLNPFSFFDYDFTIFKKLTAKKIGINTKKTRFLKAAEFIANQICLEVLWNGAKEVNWLCYNFQSKSYEFLKADQKSGICKFFTELAKNSTITFYDKFSKLCDNENNTKTTSQSVVNEDDNISEDKLIEGAELSKLINKINTEEKVKISKSIEKVRNIYTEQCFPFPNIYQNNEFDPSLEFGLAGLGYAFLRIYNSNTPKL